MFSEKSKIQRVWTIEVELYLNIYVRINVIKLSILPKAVYIVNAVPIKVPMGFFSELEQITLKIMWNHKRPWITITILRKNKVECIMLPDFKLYYKAMIKTVWHWHKNRYRSMEQNREPTNKFSLIWSIIYNKGSKNIQWRGGSLFNNWCSNNWTNTCKNI